MFHLSDQMLSRFPLKGEKWFLSE